MLKKLGKLILSIVLLASIITLPNQTNAEDTESRFICLSMFDKSNVLLSWESVPFTSSYRVYKNNEEIEKIGDDKNFFLDTEIDNKSDYIYKVESLDDNGNIISKSFDIPVSISYKENLRLISLEFTLGSNMYRVDGLEKGPMPTPPIVNSGRSYLVIRYITDELGAEIAWDGNKRKVTINSVTGDVIELWIGNPEAKINGINTKIDENDDSVVPYISEGRTLLPVRFVSDSLGADEVLWEEEEKKITLVWTEPEAPQSKITLIYNPEKKDDNKFKDWLGNKYVLKNIPDNHSLKTGNIITLAYEIDSFDTNFNFATLKTNNFSLLQESKPHIGEITQNNPETQLLKIKISSGEIKEFGYYSSDNNMKNIPEGAWIYYWLDGDGKFIRWKYVIFDIYESCEEKELFFKHEHFDWDEFYIKFEGHSIDEEIKSKFFYFRDYETDSFGYETCYEIQYFTNWLGRNIIFKLNPVDCPCNIDIQMINIPEITAGEEVSGSFTFKNYSDEKIDVVGFVKYIEGAYFPGEIFVEDKHKNVTVGAGETGEIFFTIKAYYNASGRHDIRFGVMCKSYPFYIDTFIEFKLKPVEKCDIEVKKWGLEDSYSVLDGNGDRLLYNIHNNLDEDVELKVFVENADEKPFPGKLFVKEEDETIMVKGKQGQHAFFSFTTDEGSEGNYKIRYGVICSGEKFSNTMTLKITKRGGSNE